MDHKTLFGKTSPAKLFTIVTIPGVISMLVSSLYIIIDGAFVGQILGSDAFAALNLVMPFVIINFSIADLIGVGSAVPIAIKLGEKDDKTASNIFSSACLMIVVTAVILGAVLFIFTDDLLRLMGADEHLILMATQYMQVYAICSPFTTIVFAVDNYLRICGKVRFSMFLNILMSVGSALLEFLFLFVFKFGIWGAALATCLGMSTCTVIAFIPFLRGKMHLRFSKPKISKATFKIILSNGCPSFLNNVAGRITSVVMNVFLLRMGGTAAISTYGVLMYADSFVQPILYGLCDSLQPAVGYNWGANNYNRIKSIERICFSVCAVLSLLMTIGMLLAKTSIVDIFVRAEDTALVTMAVNALSIFAFAYLTRWISFATQSYMSAVGKAGYATIISVSMAFIFPVIFIFSLSFMGLQGLWLNLPLTSLMAAIMSVIILFRFKKKDVPYFYPNVKG
ncbi:MAG: MATE family efflux transporter [Clostridiales bacterium]|nr:MAG: MATE family efflux transporter [Clostridiales bacterium]